MTDVKKKSYFGKCIGVMYVVEFQKRGLPHVHMLIWLDSVSKTYLKNNVDKFVSAEIPDPLKDPVGYAAVKDFMIHGPCGLENPKSPCMKGFKCIRHFPKKYCARTIFDDSGFPIYKRRRSDITVDNPTLILNDKQLQFYALAEIDDLLRAIGKSLKHFPMLPQPPTSYLHHGSNNLILEETNYNVAEMEVEHKILKANCNEAQLNIYNEVFYTLPRS
ncbi:hypothetical protein POM88_032446 [Heracleum sosnowskyi]|uniref:Helitron helicase-like domain-containing protein n=1 Tax=Heracleum sosnowskyi TaxID=360622 RepID=A0AAD8I066_9APIA|nr:hypothetical protein POM88_030040 [Heracleum sosnowskyi]KAK1376253.1 hypothetical protein POM88_032446 [Heracleum sosnowskyi]